MNIFDPKNNFGFRDYLKILERRKWFFIVPLVLILPLGVMKIASYKPIYASSCTLRVMPSNLQLLPASVRKSLPKVSQPITAMGFKRQILSMEYLNRVIDVLNLEQDERFRVQAEEIRDAFPEKTFDEVVRVRIINFFKGNVKVDVYGRDVLRLSCRADVPELAYSVVKTLTDVVIDDAHRKAMSNLEGALNLNDEQIQLFKKRLEEAEQRLEAFRRNMITSDLSDKNLSPETLSRVHKEISAIEINLRDKRDYLEQVETQFRGNEGAFDLNSPEISGLLNKIEEKVAEMADLMRSFSSRSPEVINTNRKINDIRDEIRIELAEQYKARNPGIDTPTLNLYLEKAMTFVDVDILNRKKGALSKLVESFREERTRDPQRELTLAKLQQDVEVNRRIYNTFVQRNQGVEIEQFITEEDAADRLEVLQPPQRPQNPMNASSRMILIVTLVAGFGLGGAAVYVREYLDTSVRTVNEAENAFGIPVIGVVPYLGKDQLYADSGYSKWKLLAFVAGAVIFIGLLVALYLMFRPDTVY